MKLQCSAALSIIFALHSPGADPGPEARLELMCVMADPPLRPGYWSTHLLRISETAEKYMYLKIALSSIRGSLVYIKASQKVTLVSKFHALHQGDFALLRAVISNSLKSGVRLQMHWSSVRGGRPPGLEARILVKHVKRTTDSHSFFSRSIDGSILVISRLRLLTTCEGDINTFSPQKLCHISPSLAFAAMKYPHVVNVLVVASQTCPVPNHRMWRLWQGWVRNFLLSPLGRVSFHVLVHKTNDTLRDTWKTAHFNKRLSPLLTSGLANTDWPAWEMSWDTRHDSSSDWRLSFLMSCQKSSVIIFSGFPKKAKTWILGKDKEDLKRDTMVLNPSWEGNQEGRREPNGECIASRRLYSLFIPARSRMWGEHLDTADLSMYRVAWKLNYHSTVAVAQHQCSIADATATYSNYRFWNDSTV